MKACTPFRDSDYLCADKVQGVVDAFDDFSVAIQVQADAAEVEKNTTVAYIADACLQ